MSTCAVVYLRTFNDPWCKGTILHRGFAIVQGAPNSGSLQINFPGWTFFISLMYWEFKLQSSQGQLIVKNSQEWLHPKNKCQNCGKFAEHLPLQNRLFLVSVTPRLQTLTHLCVGLLFWFSTSHSTRSQFFSTPQLLKVVEAGALRAAVDSTYFY